MMKLFIMSALTIPMLAQAESPRLEKYCLFTTKKVEYEITYILSGSNLAEGNIAIDDTGENFAVKMISDQNEYTESQSSDLVLTVKNEIKSPWLPFKEKGRKGIHRKVLQRVKIAHLSEAVATSMSAHEGQNLLLTCEIKEFEPSETLEVSPPKPNNP